MLRLILFLVILLLILIIISILTFIMSLLGFKYDSLISVLQFFTIVEFIILPFEVFLKIVVNKIINSQNINKKIVNLLYIIFYINAYFLVMNIVDYFMDSIKTTGIDILVISAILSILSLKLDIFENKKV